MILLLSGTSEGRILSARLRTEGLPFVASVTTPEARQLFAALDPAPEILVTRFSGDTLVSFLRERQVGAILDATHPFAQRISEKAIQAAAQERIPYVRYERPTTAPAETSLVWEGGEVIMAPDVETAAQTCLLRGSRVFLTTGTKTLPVFRQVM